MMHTLSTLLVFFGLLLSGMNFQAGNGSIGNGHQGPSIVSRPCDGTMPPPPPPPPPPLPPDRRG